MGRLLVPLECHASWPRERELLERVPKEKGRGAVHHNMPGSTVQSHQGDASYCKAKGRCQSSVLAQKETWHRWGDLAQLYRVSSGLWTPLWPDAGKGGKGCHPFQVSEAFDSLFPGCSLSLYKEQSQVLAEDDLAEMTDVHSGGQRQELVCSCLLHGLPEYFLQPPIAAAKCHFYRNANTIHSIFFHTTKAHFIPVKPSVPSQHWPIKKQRKVAVLRFQSQVYCLLFSGFTKRLCASVSPPEKWVKDEVKESVSEHGVQGIMGRQHHAGPAQIKSWRPRSCPQ